MDIKSKKWLNIFGKIILLVSFAFLVVKIFRYRDEITIEEITRNPIRIAGIMGLVFSQTISLCGNAALYYRLLISNSTNAISRKYVKAIYVRTNIYKYLPGNVMQMVGKNQIAVDTPLSHKRVAMTTVTELICVSFSAGLVGLVFLKDRVLYYLAGLNRVVLFLLVCGFVLVLLVALIITYRKKQFRDIVSSSITVLLCMVAFESMCGILNGLFFSLILYSVEELSPGSMAIGIGAYSLSWLIGFITPGAPGGVGVREAVLMMLLEGMADHGQIIISLILSRVAFIIADLLAFLLLDFIPRRKELLLEEIS